MASRHTGQNLFRERSWTKRSRAAPGLLVRSCSGGSSLEAKPNNPAHWENTSAAFLAARGDSCNLLRSKPCSMPGPGARSLLPRFPVIPARRYFLTDCLRLLFNRARLRAGEYISLKARRHNRGACRRNSCRRRVGSRGVSPGRRVQRLPPSSLWCLRCKPEQVVILA